MNGEFSGYDYIRNLFDGVYREDAFNVKTVDEHKQWAEKARKKLIKILGMHTFEKSKLSPVTTEIREFSDFRCEKITITTQENLKMPFYMLTPKAGSNNKAIIAIHGHGSDGKEGLIKNEREIYRESCERFNYIYARYLAKIGYTVFVPDLLGNGERMLGVSKGTEPECTVINNACISLGISLQGIHVFDLMRLVDYIKEYTELDEKIGVCGFSGGGFSGILLSAVDERISYAIISGYFHSFKDVLIYSNKCGCNFIPDLWKSFDMCDIAAMVAPRPLFIETGIRDNLNGDKGIRGVEDQVDIAQQAYRLYGKQIALSMQEGEHRWFGSCYSWLNSITNIR